MSVRRSVPNITKPPLPQSSSQQHRYELSDHPTLENLPVHSEFRSLQEREEKIDKKRGQEYEQEDYISEHLKVTAFKKVSLTNFSNRVNCFVTMFPFSG